MRLAHRGEALAACFLLPAALELVPATTLFSWLRRIPARRGSAARPEELASIVDRTLVRLPGPWRHTCLRRALVLSALLRRDARDAEVVIGVRGSAATLEAHAWLRCDGIEPFLENGAVDSYSPLR